MFFTLSVINSSSLVKLPALISINTHSLPKAGHLKGLALYKKLTFQRLTFMPNQEYNHLAFKSFSIHVFWHFYSKVVHFMRLPARRREQFKDWLSLYLVLLYLYCQLIFLISVISIGSGLYRLQTTCRKRFWSRQQPERMDMVNKKRIYSLTPACEEHELVFKCAQLLHSKQNERWEMPCAGKCEKFETAKAESLFSLWYKVNTLSNRFNI